VFIIAYSLSFSIIRLLTLVCLEIAMHNEQFHSFVQFIHSSNKGQCIHATFGIHTILYNHTSFFFFFFLFFIPSFFSLTRMRMCALLSLKIFSKRAYIYCKHTCTYQYCHIYLCVHNFLPPFSLKYLSRFIHGVIYNFVSSFIVHTS
jgi:hypothetical protein